MKCFKFELGGMYIFYFGENIGQAILEFLANRGPNYLKDLESITEEPIKEYDRP
jgi:hypothetical protein